MHHACEGMSAGLVTQRGSCEAGEGRSSQRCLNMESGVRCCRPPPTLLLHLLRLPEEPLEVVDPEDLELLLPDRELLRDELEPEDRELDDRDGDLDLPMAPVLRDPQPLE
jgi:hypothetical protein